MTRACIVFVVGAVLLLTACGDKDKKPSEPEIISTSPGTRSVPANPSNPAAPAQPAAPADIIRTSTGGLTLSPGIPATGVATAAGEQGLTVRHSESARVKADDAYIVVLTQPRPPIGPGASSLLLPSRDQAAVIAKLEAMGIAKSAITFDSAPNFGPFPGVNVNIPVADVASKGKAIVDAIEAELGRGSSTGVRYGLKDCSAAVGPVRSAAYKVAQAKATEIAGLASVTLGPVIGLSETLAPQTVGGPPIATDPCNPLLSSGPRSGPQGLDSEPEVRVQLEVTLTYSLAGGAPAAGGLTASGSGSATAKADEAYVIVSLPGVPTPFGQSGITSKQRSDLMAKLKGLRIDEDDIEIVTPDFGGLGFVSVEVPTTNLATRGKEIAAAIEDTLQTRLDTQGVRFSHSNCEAVLNEARKQALADLTRSSEALATVAGVKLGKITAISEPRPTTPYPPATRQAGCDDNLATLSNFGYGGTAGLKAFDAEPEFTVTALLSATYAMEGP